MWPEGVTGSTVNLSLEQWQQRQPDLLVQPFLTTTTKLYMVISAKSMLEVIEKVHTAVRIARVLGAAAKITSAVSMTLDITFL